MQNPIFLLSWKGVWGKTSLGPKRPENMPFGIFSAEAGPEGPEGVTLWWISFENTPSSRIIQRLSQFVFSQQQPHGKRPLFLF